MRRRRSQTLAVLSAKGSDGSGASTQAAKTPAASAAGAHVGWADYEKNPAAAPGKVVPFFHAGWCPTCQEAERNLTSEPRARGSDRRQGRLRQLQRAAPEVRGDGAAHLRSGRRLRYPAGQVEREQRRGGDPGQEV